MVVSMQSRTRPASGHPTGRSSAIIGFMKTTELDVSSSTGRARPPRPRRGSLQRASPAGGDPRAARFSGAGDVILLKTPVISTKSSLLVPGPTKKTLWEPGGRGWHRKANPCLNQPVQSATNTSPSLNRSASVFYRRVFYNIWTAADFFWQNLAQDALFCFAAKPVQNKVLSQNMFIYNMLRCFCGDLSKICPPRFRGWQSGATRRIVNSFLRTNNI